ncbi:MAG: DUF1361 domain-containing protein [Gaiella sp.]|nr:DUF1361 domain-containing protein [Gaiella sp.]
MMRALGGGRAASRRRSVLVKALLASSLVLALGVGLRVGLTQTLDATNLVWNLFLAWIPFGLALVLYDGARRGLSPAALLALGTGWLLFLPNAPYIVTDVKWLGEYEGGALWYDAALIGLAATIGLVLGFVSLYLVQVVIAERFGHLAGWALAWSALVLSGIGVYLGRFQRWNSWQVVTEPWTIGRELFGAALDPFAHARPLALSTAFAILWCAGYALFYSTFRGQLRRLSDR